MVLGLLLAAGVYGLADISYRISMRRSAVLSSACTAASNKANTFKPHGVPMSGPHSLDAMLPGFAEFSPDLKLDLLRRFFSKYDRDFAAASPTEQETILYRLFPEIGLPEQNWMSCTQSASAEAAEEPFIDDRPWIETRPEYMRGASPATTAAAPSGEKPRHSILEGMIDDLGLFGPAGAKVTYIDNIGTIPEDSPLWREIQHQAQYEAASRENWDNATWWAVVIGLVLSVPRVWYFLLGRIAELSAAIKGQ
jgi:hypothetical protein